MKNKQILKEDKSLSKIIIPKDKINMFLEWYNKDIRLQENIPHSFNEGYIIVHTDIKEVVDISKYNKYFSALAKTLHCTYRDVENRFKYFLDCLSTVTIHFKFLENTSYLNVYAQDKTLLTKINFQVCEGANEEFDLKESLNKCQSWDDIQNTYNKLFIVLFDTAMWYLATTTKTTKYYYEQKTPMYKHSRKKEINVKPYKTITTPIYDMNKIRKVKVEHLIKRRQGFTYSHSFEVHGHFRHYKDGKVIFIESYTKGKNKPKMAQTITINPEIN